MHGLKILLSILIVVVLGQSYALYNVYGPGGELDVKEELRQIKIAKPEELSESQLKKLIMAECSLVPHTLDGTSLQPAFKHGTTHVFYEGEPCPIKEMIQKNSIVLLRTGASVVPIAKFVKALPGDKLKFDRRAGRINVLTVNGKDVTNSAGQLYSIPRGTDTLLQRYIEQYKGVVPINAYLLLGDNPRGSLDSTKLGLVHVSDMVGVMRDNPYEGKADFVIVPKAPVNVPRPVSNIVTTEDPAPMPAIPEDVIQNLLPKGPIGSMPEGIVPPEESVAKDSIKAVKDLAAEVNAETAAEAAMNAETDIVKPSDAMMNISVTSTGSDILLEEPMEDITDKDIDLGSDGVLSPKE